MTDRRGDGREGKGKEKRREGNRGERWEEEGRKGEEREVKGLEEKEGGGKRIRWG